MVEAGQTYVEVPSLISGVLHGAEIMPKDII